MARLLIGTSGWHYASWRGPFYPKTLPVSRQLAHYATQFSSAELNSVFYRTPTPQAVMNWREQTGNDFVFAWKASKFITHWKRLLPSCVTSLQLLESRLALLKKKADAARLTGFCTLLNARHRYSFEFRHPSWYTPEVYKILTDHNIALCISDHADAPAPWRRTANFVYVRGHGPGGLYKDNYPEATLSTWSRRIRSWLRQGFDVFVYFDNDQKSAAPADAAQLRSRLDAMR